LSSQVSADLYFNTEVNSSGEYIISMEIVNPNKVQKELFVVTRADPTSAKVEFNRVASINDLLNLKKTGVSEARTYLTDSVTIKTKSISLVKDYRDTIPKVLQDLINDIGKDALTLIGKEETISVEYEDE
tara:strand:- start:42863 stop:43252 length:390 start_codon:yes stop_codon:yes gene_type:complete